MLRLRHICEARSALLVAQGRARDSRVKAGRSRSEAVSGLASRLRCRPSEKRVSWTASMKKSAYGDTGVLGDRL